MNEYYLDNFAFIVKLTIKEKKVKEIFYYL